MSKQQIVEIKGHKYKYKYNPSNKLTEYLGPVGDSPQMSEEEFLRAIDPATGRILRGALDTETSHETRLAVYQEGGINLAKGKLDFSDWLQIWDEESPVDSYEMRRTLLTYNVIDDIEKKYQKDIKKLDNSKTFVTATIVAMLNEMDFRVGNRKTKLLDAGHLGAITQRLENVEVVGNTVKFEYVGKAGVKHVRESSNPLIVDAVRHLEEQRAKGKSDPKEFLFKYKGQGGRFIQIRDDDVRAYLKEFGISPKDIRTHNANQYFIDAWNDTGNVTNSVKKTAGRLQNMPSVTKRSYIDPYLLEDLNIVQKEKTKKAKAK